MRRLWHNRVWLALAITLGVWVWFAWPLPRHAATAIPFGATKFSAAGRNERMVPGDHLQLLYHLWLGQDMVFGRTPLFYNLYEFNTGDDEARRAPSSYYVPFSLLFALGFHAGGMALGWNLAGLLALWGTYYFTWRLVRRYNRDEICAALAALPAITLPVLWINLGGGSPAGFAMMWLPALLWGLDLALREDRVGGGLLAGGAILGASFCDMHVFFFGALLLPGWGLVAILQRPGFWRRPWAAWRRTGAALAPLAAGLALAVGISQLIVAQRTQQTGGGNADRLVPEVALFTPTPAGLFSWQTHGVQDHIYLGYAILLLLALGAAAALALRRRLDWRLAVTGALLLAGITGVILLAFGPLGPADGLLFNALRKLAPPFRMVRQPAKIFCLMPVLLSAAAAVSFGLMAGWWTRPWARRLAMAGLAALVVLDYRLQTRVLLCGLDPGQGAYQAVSASAGESGSPLALVIPLWPGDTHFSAIYQYYAMLYHIRLVNGYKPTLRKAYVEEIYAPLESINWGVLTEAQADNLQRRGVGYLILHEDLFPEKVSPLPAGHTLQQFLRNPRLRLIAQDGPVWAFALVPADAPAADPTSVLPEWPYAFTHRHLQLEYPAHSNGVVMADTDAGAGQFRRLQAGDVVTLGPGLGLMTNQLRWLVRLRGHATLATVSTTDNSGTTPDTADIQADAWTWQAWPAPAAQAPVQATLVISNITGTVDLDMAILAHGPWPATWQRGERMTLPAAGFFHAGHTDPSDGAVVLTADRDRRGAVFYGPKMPLPAGRYRADLAFSTPAAPNTVLGFWAAFSPPGNESGRADIVAGQPATLEWLQSGNLPFSLVVDFAGAADLRLLAVTVERVD